MKIPGLWMSSSAEEKRDKSQGKPTQAGSWTNCYGLWAQAPPPPPQRQAVDTVGPVMKTIAGVTVGAVLVGVTAKKFGLKWVGFRTTGNGKRTLGEVWSPRNGSMAGGSPSTSLILANQRRVKLLSPVGLAGAVLFGGTYFCMRQNTAEKKRQIEMAAKAQPADASGMMAKAQPGDVTGTVVKTVGVGAAGGVVVTKLATVALKCYGFAKSGVVGGSFAAASQSAIGNVVAGSTFASLQTVGATGGFAILGPVGIAAGFVVGGACLGVIWYYNRIEENEENSANEKGVIATYLGW